MGRTDRRLHRPAAVSRPAGAMRRRDGAGPSWIVLCGGDYARTASRSRKTVSGAWPRAGASARASAGGCGVHRQRGVSAVCHDLPDESRAVLNVVADGDTVHEPAAAIWYNYRTAVSAVVPVGRLHWRCHSTFATDRGWRLCISAMPERWHLQRRCHRYVIDGRRILVHMRSESSQSAADALGSQLRDERG